MADNSNGGGGSVPGITSDAQTTHAMERALEQGSGRPGESGVGLAGDQPVSQPGDNLALDLPLDVLDAMPRGFDVDLESPHVAEIVGEARQFAAELGLDQKGFSRMVGMYAKAQANEFKALQEASAQQMRALGANGAARIDALSRELVAKLGDVGAKSLLGVLFTKTQVEALEGLLKMARGASVPAPRSFGGYSGGNDLDYAEHDSLHGRLNTMTRALTAGKSSGGRRR